MRSEGREVSQAQPDSYPTHNFQLQREGKRRAFTSFSIYLQMRKCHMYTYIYIYTLSTCIYILYTYVHVHICMYICIIYIQFTRTHIYIYIHIYIYTRINRALRARRGLRDNTIGLYQGIILCNYISG